MTRAGSRLSRRSFRVTERSVSMPPATVPVRSGTDSAVVMFPHSLGPSGAPSTQRIPGAGGQAHRYPQEGCIKPEGDKTLTSSQTGYRGGFGGEETVSDDD